MKTKKEMNYGNKDQLTASDLDVKKAKIRITTMIDLPVYDALKEEAATMGIGYQTLINMILSHHTGRKEDPMDMVKDLLERIYEKVNKPEGKKARTA